MNRRIKKNNDGWTHNYVFINAQPFIKNHEGFDYKNIILRWCSAFIASVKLCS